jgi:RHS repeat-associated protein
MLSQTTSTGSSYYRARYYDASVGRFIIGDPINFAGGYNFYVYVRNNPVILIDPTGFQDQGTWGTSPPNPNINAHVCDDKGNQIVQIPSGEGTPEQRACGLLDCVRVHEERHIKDSMAAMPDICKGKPAGAVVGSSGLTHTKTEIAASAAEIICLQNKLKNACDNCKKLIDDRIKQMRGYRDSFKK